MQIKKCTLIIDDNNKKVYMEVCLSAEGKYMLKYKSI